MQLFHIMWVPQVCSGVRLLRHCASQMNEPRAASALRLVYRHCASLMNENRSVSAPRLGCDQTRAPKMKTAPSHSIHSCLLGLMRYE